jgi:hypothetical protein
MEGRRRTVKQALGGAPAAAQVRSSSFPIEEWLFHFLHLSTLNRLHPALLFSGCFHAVVLFAEMPSFYCMLD